MKWDPYSYAKNIYNIFNPKGKNKENYEEDFP